MSHSVRRHLHLEIDEYDEIIRQFIPCYDRTLEEVAQAVDLCHPKRVLDLGAGTGALSEAILEKCGDSVVELIDVDDEMLARARMRLQRFGERVRLRRQSFYDSLPPCDAVVASLALHHVPDLDAKARLFGRIHDALAPGGVFVNSDATMPDDASRRAADYAVWAAHMVSRGIPKERAYRHFDEWSDEDTYFPLECELEAMTRAGFDARCIWSQIPISVLVGRKRCGG
ncbi:MAG: methyltransferase domain-containing protein [Acidobacteriota bacterium]|nr:methyltransferase domain-containing protein [Acidobacteriota bacterium]